MLFWERWLRRDDSLEIGRLARQIAATCENGVAARLDRATPQMSYAEARGYVRARASALVRPEAERVAARHPQLSAAAQQQLLTSATDTLVDWLTRDLFVVQPVPVNRAA